MSKQRVTACLCAENSKVSIPTETWFCLTRLTFIATASMSQCEYNANTFLNVYKLQFQHRPRVEVYVLSLLPQRNDTFTSQN